MLKIGRYMAMAVLVALMVAGVRSPTQAQSGPDGTIQIDLYKAGFIVGVSGGSGTMYYQGQSYPLSIGGVSLGATIGVSKAELIGEVYNLSSPYDIAGIYSATQSSYAVASGDSAAILQNVRGVELQLRGKQLGLEFSIDLSGISISLQ